MLAGGRSSRLGGRDKARLQLAGVALVDRVVSAARGCGAVRVIVVGDADVTARADEVVRETPRFAGPAAAVHAGLNRVSAAETLLLSCDLVNPDAVCAALSARFNGHDGVVIEEHGFRQWLAGRYRTDALRDAFARVAQPLADQSLRSVLASLRLDGIRVRTRLSADIDTPDDYAAAQTALREDAHDG